MGRRERGGEGKIRLPAGLVRLTNPYTGRTGALIGAVGCKLIYDWQSKVVFSSGRSKREREELAISSREKMADSLSFDDALAETLLSLSELDMSRLLRPEQKEAISSLVHGSDLLAVLTTGFGKSLVFQFLIRVKQILSSKAACVIVVCPLKSIVQDQLTEASSMGLTVTSLAIASLQDVEHGKNQLIFASAEEILVKPFLSSLKEIS